MTHFLSPLKRWSCLILAIGLSGIAQAQTGIGVAGFGYRKPASTITAAPGQVMIVSVFGVAERIPDALFPLTANGYPTEVKGITVAFVQGLVTVQLPIRGIQQSACPASGACSPATTLTLQNPYELNPGSSTPAYLDVKEGGATVAKVTLSPVSDSVHLISTCDETGIFLSLAYGVPADTCVAMVMHAGGPLVSQASPAKPGETLVAWAYGLGAVDHPMPEPCCSSPDQLPLAVQPFTVNFCYADAGRFPLRRLAAAVPSYVGMVGSGIYQVHFVVPSVPADLALCSARVGNLSVQVGGPQSADATLICVQP